MHAPQSPSSAAAPQPFQTSQPPAMGHPPLSPPGQQPPLMGSPPPMGMAGPPGPGVSMGGHQQALGPQSYPQQPGKIAILFSGVFSSKCVQTQKEVLCTQAHLVDKWQDRRWQAHKRVLSQEASLGVQLKWQARLKRSWTLTLFQAR